MDREHFDNICNTIEKPDVMFDVGVADVNTEAWWAKEFWQDIPIFGFEPCDTKWRYLHSYPGELNKMAVTDSVGVFHGYMNNHDFKIKAEEDEKDPYRKVTMESTTIDELDSIHGPFNNIFIWADIEGGELTLLRGAKKVLSEGRVSAINIEMWPVPPIDGWPTPEETIDYLKGFGYNIVFGSEGDYESWERKMGNHMDFLFIKKSDSD